MKIVLQKHEDKFLHDYAVQMTMIKKIIKELQERVDYYKKYKGSSESNFQKILTERNFFKHESVFLQKENEKLKTKLILVKKKNKDMKLNLAYYENFIKKNKFDLYDKSDIDIKKEVIANKIKNLSKFKPLKKIKNNIKNKDITATFNTKWDSFFNNSNHFKNEEVNYLQQHLFQTNQNYLNQKNQNLKKSFNKNLKTFCENENDKKKSKSLFFGNKKNYILTNSKRLTYVIK